MAFYVNLAAFLDEAFYCVCETSPGNDVVPFCVFLKISGAVTVTLCSCESESGHLCIGAVLRISFKVTYCWILTHVTDKHCFVE